MKKHICIDGQAIISSNGENSFNFEFQPDEPPSQHAPHSLMKGKAQLMRSGTFYFVPSKPRVRNNALLICKAAHGRLSGTRDHGFQLTLKVFASEGIDWQRAFLCESVDLLTNLMGPERMALVLAELITKLNC